MSVGDYWTNRRVSKAQAFLQTYHEFGESTLLVGVTCVSLADFREWAKAGKKLYRIEYLKKDQAAHIERAGFIIFFPRFDIESIDSVMQLSRLPTAFHVATLAGRLTSKPRTDFSDLPDFLSIEQVIELADNYFKPKH